MTTLEQLLARPERLDRIIMEIEQLLWQKPLGALSLPEQIILAIESLEREVNNGGYEQFFINPSNEFVGLILSALEAINCPQLYQLTAEAIAVLGVSELNNFDLITETALNLADVDRDRLAQLTERYYANDEVITEQLFKFIRQHQAEVLI
ncbi:MAG: DUF4375 domain-containing protein [Pseudanabaenaceae cyanobacterium bins.68]|nr:DUF4375 domain-containing protein [Pseudanabaenaceae cyanobacterium bins.68]